MISRTSPCLRASVVKSILCAGLLFLLTCGCQEAGPPPGADLSAPKPAALFYLKAVQRGDAAVAKKVCIGTAEEKQWVDSLAATVVGLRKFNDALYTKFGRYVSQVHLDLETQLRELADDPVALIAEGKVYEDANEARIEPARHGFASHSQHPIYLRHGLQGWMVDLPRTYATTIPADKLAEVTAGYRAMRRVADIFQSTAADVLAGKLHSVDEAKAALETRIAADLHRE